MKVITTSAVALLAVMATPIHADSVTVTIQLLSDKGIGKSIGTIRAEDSRDGLVMITNLRDLSPGGHGFHVHEHGSCDSKERDGKMIAGLAAGGHYDPRESGKHFGPKGQGHLGDLPVLIADGNGNAKMKISASRLKVADLRGRSLVIHDGGDNYSDDPKPLGGEGPRFACGVVK
jgi:superoxide dismutase, Cu-Zn family